MWFMAATQRISSRLESSIRRNVATPMNRVTGSTIRAKIRKSGRSVPMRLRATTDAERTERKRAARAKASFHSIDRVASRLQCSVDRI